MVDLERAVLDFYQVQELYPLEWPTDKDNREEPEEEDARTRVNRRKSRYEALERAVSNRNSVIPGSENAGRNLVQKDEPDPLGSTESVVRTLKQLGVPLQDDPNLRNRFLLSSTTFSPALFLSQMHAKADTKTLLYGLEVLSQSIDQKSASLKVLVESNFERFVRAKSTIDNVYKEMKYRGVEPSPPRARPHSRHASKNGFRSSTIGTVLASPLSPGSDTRKKNALVKESEYGVMGIKGPLLEVSAKAEDVWGPALGGRDKEENLKTVASFVYQYKEYVEASAVIADSIKRKDHESLVEEYLKARKFADEANKLADEIGSSQPTDAQLYQILVAARMWHDVDEQISAFKRDAWRRLTSLHTSSQTESAPRQRQYLHMELITILLELGVEDNPIWMWLLSRYDYLKGRIQLSADRSRAEVEVLRRRLASAEKPVPQLIAQHMRYIGRQSFDHKLPSVDQADIVELWEKMLALVASLLSAQGILGEVLDFWQTVDDFIEGKTQRTLPTGHNGESLRHHRLAPENIDALRKATVEIVDMVRGQIHSFFTEMPPEDISLLCSSMPPSPLTPATPAGALSGSLSPKSARDARFPLSPNILPPPSPKRGEVWEKYAFWPPWSNSLSGIYYLSKMLTLVGSGASDLAGLSPVREDAAELDKLKFLVGAARERCVGILCSAWNRDAENVKYVEDWQRSTDPEHRDVTKMPASFALFEGTMLSGMQKILYVSEAMSKAGAGDIVLPPPTKLLQSVRSQYVTTLYKALSGMVENAERSIKMADDEWTTNIDGYVIVSGPTADQVPIGGAVTVSAGDRNIRMLLTLSNLQRLRSEVVPNLNTQFENAFAVKLTDETKTIRDVLGQIDARLFQSYTRPAVEEVRKTIRAGIASPDWVPPPGEKPREVRPYVYEALLSLVLVHSQVSTTAQSLSNQVLSYLLEQTSRELLDAFRARPRYNLEALMQATLDVEFVAQTLSQYTTDRATELQGQIYQELDGRTDNDSRARLQGELPEMRSVLKRLRESSKNEFACFRKPKKGHRQFSGDAGSGLERTDTNQSIGSDR